MIKTRALTAALTAGAIAALVAVLPAQGRDPAGSKLLSFKTSQKQGDERFIDLAPKGPSAGDRVALTSTLHRAGKVAGRLEADCAWTEVHFEVLQCSVVLIFPDGRVTLEGAYANKKIPGVGGTHEEYAITGGSGAYEGATGTMQRTGGGTRDALTLSVGLAPAGA